MRKAFVLLTILVLSFGATVRAQENANHSGKTYSIEWEGSSLPPIQSAAILIVEEYTADNNLIQRHFTDTISEGFKTELVAKADAAYVVICYYDKKYVFPLAYPLMKLEGQHPELVVTKKMQPGLRGSQTLNKKGEVVTKKKKLAPHILP